MHPTILSSVRPFLPSIFLSIRVISNESTLRIRWPKYWSFSISASSKFSGLISFMIDWFDLLAVQGTLKRFLQPRSLTQISIAYYPSAFKYSEATVRTRHGTTGWFQIGKGVCQGYILSLCLFNLYAEYILQNAGLDEVQAGIKMARRNINNLRYSDNTTLMAESEELKSLLMKVTEENGKVGLKVNIQKTKIMASGSITSWQIDGETMETVTDFILGGLQNHCR